MRLPSWEREFWLRLIDNVTPSSRHTAARRGRAERPSSWNRDRPSRPCGCTTAADRAAVAFSGGKDSIVLAALAAELTDARCW